MFQKQEVREIKPFIIGIAKNKLKKYYSLKNKDIKVAKIFYLYYT